MCDPILVSFVAKGLLPYHGLGSGIKRALDAWPQVDFIDDRDGCLFTATVYRKPVGELTLVIRSPKTSGKMSGKTSGKILAALKEDGYLTIPDLASMIGVTERSIERNIKKLQEQNRLRRIGPAKGGYWEAR
jgi:ATP-dependent DNA helicase RecG